MEGALSKAEIMTIEARQKAPLGKAWNPEKLSKADNEEPETLLKAEGALSKVEIMTMQARQRAPLGKASNPEKLSRADNEEPRKAIEANPKKLVLRLRFLLWKLITTKALQSLQPHSYAPLQPESSGDCPKILSIRGPTFRLLYKFLAFREQYFAPTPI